jgi:Ca2+-binding EF-hand superfamily protein/PAS domain-containing protein
VFKYLDKNHDNTLELDELLDVVNTLANSPSWTGGAEDSPDAISAAFNAVDSDGDGVISLEEFQAMYQSHPEGGTLFSLLQKMEPVIIKEMERSKKAHRESSQTLKFECVLEHEAKKKLKHSDDKKKFIKKFETDFAAAFGLEASRIKLDKDDIERSEHTTVKFKVKAGTELDKSSSDIRQAWNAELQDESKKLELGGFEIDKNVTLNGTPALGAEAESAELADNPPDKKFKKKRKAASSDPFESDGQAKLYAACAQGNIIAIKNIVQESRKMLPVGALNAAIYHLEMEAVNYLISSGFVDPNEEAPVPVQTASNARKEGLSKAGLYSTDEESTFLYGPVPKFRELHVAELKQPRRPYDLVEHMYRQLKSNSSEAAKPAKKALRFMKGWLEPRPFGELDEETGTRKKEVNKPWMDMKTVMAVFDAKAEVPLFDKDRDVLSGYDKELENLWQTFYPNLVDVEVDGQTTQQERIEVGVFIELMENLGHDYVMEELQAMLPDLDVASEGIEFDYFKFVVTSMYMRVLNQFCDFKDGLNIDLRSDMSMHAGSQFKTSAATEEDDQIKIARILQVLLEIGLPTTHQHVIDEVRKVVNDSENKITEIRYYKSKTNESCDKLKFGDFCVLATKLLVWQRGNSCSQCLQHTAYKFNNCFRNGFFLTAHLLLLVLFILGALAFLVLAYDEVNKSPTVDAGFQRMIDNWQIQPIVEITYYQKGMNPLGDGVCPSGWERSPTMTWPGSAAGPCVCPQFALPYTSTSGECTSSQTSAGCATQAGTSAATVSGLTGTLCFLRGGAPPATWDNSSDAYTERPMLLDNSSSCPSTHIQCGSYSYSENAMCQIKDVACPVRRMLMVTGLFNWSDHYSATYPYVEQIGPSSTPSQDRKYLAYDQPVNGETAYARHASELDVSLDQHCSDGTTQRYATTLGAISADGTATTSYTSSTANCTPSTEWFELDSVTEQTALGNAINQSAQCESQTTTTTGRRSTTAGRQLQSAPAVDEQEEEAPPDWWTDVVECPTEEASVKDLETGAVGKKSAHAEWITDVDGTECHLSPAESLYNADPPDTTGLPPHLRPASKASSAAVQPIAVDAQSRETFTPVSFARKLQSTGNTCVDEVTCVAKIDLVFVMDSSGSIGYSNYQTMLSFAQLTVAKLEIGPNNVQVGFLVYSLTPEYTSRRRRRYMRRRNYDWDYSNYHTFWQFKFGDYTNHEDMSSAIGSSRYLSATTFTGEAIRLAYEELFDTSSTSQARCVSSGVSKMMVILTDGYATDFSNWNVESSTSYCGVDGTNYATVAKAKGASIFALGVSGYDPAQINGLASDPDSKYARQEGSFSTLMATSFVETLIDGICSTPVSTGDDAPVSTECCAKDTYTYYKFTAPSFSSRTISLTTSNGATDFYYSAVNNVAGTSADDTSLAQPTDISSYTKIESAGTVTANPGGTIVTTLNTVSTTTNFVTTTQQWTPACGTDNMCVMWVALQCTEASTNFTITQSEDATPPTITTYDPTQNQVVVTTQRPSIVMTFDEVVEVAAGANSSCSWTVTATSATEGGSSNRIVGDGSNVQYVSYGVITTGTIPVSTVTLTMATDLTWGREYEVQIGSWCVADTSGNLFAGLKSGNYKFTIYDNTAPYVTQYNPVQEAIGVLGTSNVVLTFNVPVQTIDSSFKVTFTPDDTSAASTLTCYPEGNTGCTATVNNDNNTLTMDLPTDFHTTTKMRYTVTVDCRTMGNLYCSETNCGYGATTSAPTSAPAFTPGASTVSAYDCAGTDATSSNPIQVMYTGKTSGYQNWGTRYLDVANGEYKDVWSFRGDSALATSGKAWKNLNGVSINPFDSKAYGVVKLTSTSGVSGSNNWVVRFDTSGVEFVAQINFRSYSGTFDREFGLFFLIDNSANKIYAYKELHLSDGTKGSGGSWPTVTDWTSSNFVSYSFTASGTNYADCIPYQGQLEGAAVGTKNYIIGGGSASKLIIVRYEPTNSATLPTFTSNRVFTITLDTGGSWPNTAKGAGWNYNDNVYFASNSGAGVYKIDMSTLDWSAQTVEATRIGSSDANGNNDGMNCFHVSLPCGWDGTGMMAAITSPTYRFTTKDDAAPYIVEETPTNDGECVATTTGMVLKFNEAIQVVAGKKVTLYSYSIAGDYVTFDSTDRNGGVIEVTLTDDMDSTDSTNDADKKLTFTNSQLGGALKAGNRYYVDFPADAVKDTSQNALYNGLSGATGQYSFDICGTTPPVITTYEPANGAIDQPQDLSFTFTFYDATTMSMVNGEEIELWKAHGSAGSYTYTHEETIYLLDSMRATMFETAGMDSCPPKSGYVGSLDATSCYILPVTAEITFKFPSLLESGATYSIVMTGVVEDTQNTKFAGLTVGNYHVTIADQQPPYIINYNPYNGESNIFSESLTEIVLTFNENVQAGICDGSGINRPCLSVTQTSQIIRISNTDDSNEGTCDANPAAADTTAPTAKPWYEGMTITSTGGGTTGLTARITGYPALLTTDTVTAVTDYCSFVVGNVDYQFAVGMTFEGDLKTMTVDDYSVTQTLGAYVVGDIIRGLDSGAYAVVKKVNGNTPDVLQTSGTFIAKETVYFELTGAFAKYNSIATSSNNPTGKLLAYDKSKSTSLYTQTSFHTGSATVEFERDTTNTAQVTFSGPTMTIKVPSTLSSQTSYAVYLMAGAVKDVATTTNDHAGLNFNYTFMTSAIVPPPSAAPTVLPSWAPITSTFSPTNTWNPTAAPTEYPSVAPSSPAPTGAPSTAPTVAPTKLPTKAPTTWSPTNTGVTTRGPTQTDAPTDPTEAPSWAPSPAPTSVAPTKTPTEYPSSAPTTVGPTPAPDDCQTDDSLCFDSARTECDTAEAFADDATKQFYLSYSREAKWTPGCSAGDKDTVYVRRSADTRQEGDWQEEMIAVHVPFFALLLTAGVILEMYAYYKIDGVLCFPPWAIHILRCVAIVLSALLLFYCVSMFIKVYDEYTYYDNVLSDPCTDTEYEPPFNTMRDSLQTMYEYDFMVVIFDLLVLIWFCLLLCCMSVKIFRRFDATKWACWQADLPEYMSAGNGLSSSCFYWDGQLPEEDGCPCGNTYVNACGCNCTLCTASPQGARIDIDVLGARRRMYYRWNDPDENTNSDQQAIGVEPSDDADTSQLSKSPADGGTGSGAGSGVPVVPSRQAGRRLIQGAPPIIIPHVLLPQPEDKPEPDVPEDPDLLDEEDGPMAEEPWNGQSFIGGFGHATVKMSGAETWQIGSDDKVVDSSDHANGMCGPAESLDELKDQLTDASRKALEDAQDAAKRGEVTPDLVLEFKEPGDDLAQPEGGATRKRKPKKKKTPKEIFEEHPDMPLSEMFKLLDPESMEVFNNKINDFAKCGDLDEPLSSLTNPALDKIISSPFASDSFVGGKSKPQSADDSSGNNKPISGPGQSRKPRQRNTVAKWIGNDALQPLGSDPSVADFDGHLRDLLKDSDLDLKRANPEGGDVDFNDNSEPLSELFKLLDPDSQKAMINKINDFADRGDLDEPLSKLSDEMRNKIDNSADGLIPLLEENATPDEKHNTVMKWVGDDLLADLAKSPEFGDFDGRLKDLIMGSDMQLSMAGPEGGDNTVGAGGEDEGPEGGASRDPRKRKKRKDKNPFEDERPLSEIFKMLDPDSRDALINSINDLAEQGKLDDILKGLPSSIRNKIDQASGGSDKPVGDGGKKPGRNKKARDTVMKWLEDPQLQDLLANVDVEAFDQALREMLLESDLDLKMADVLGNAMNLNDCDLLDFAASLSDLTEDSRNNVLSAIRQRLNDIPLDDWPLIEDVKFVGGKATRNPRQITADDVMDLLMGGDTMSDEFKCETERFMKEKGILSEEYFQMFAVDFVPDNKIVTLKVGVTPMMKFDEKSDKQSLLTDHFMIDAAEDMIFQLQPAQAEYGDNYINYKIIDGNAAAITALGFTNMNSVVGKPINEFLTGDDMGEMLHDSILKAIEQATHSSLGDAPDAIEIFLDMATKAGTTIRARVNIAVDPNQFLEDAWNNSKTFLPILKMKLVKRPIWELVQNGPMLITTRPDTDFNGNDIIHFANPKAKSLMINKYLPAEMFNTGSVEATNRRPEATAELRKQFGELYDFKSEVSPSSVDILMCGSTMHGIISQLTHPDMGKLTLDSKPLYGVLCDCSGSVIVATDMKGRVIDMNDEATEKLTGESFAEDNLALDHLGRHFTRYIDPLDRKLVVEKFQQCLTSGKPKIFDKMIVMTSSDFDFDMGAATYDLTLSMQLYPHFDKYGKVAGIVFEGKEVSLIKLEADVVAHIFSHVDDYDNPEKLDYADDQFNELYDMEPEDYFDDMEEYGCLELRKLHAPMFGLGMAGTVEALTDAAMRELEKEDKNEIMGCPFEDFLESRSVNDFHTLCEQVKADPTQPLCGDMFIKGSKTPNSVTISPWYNKRAEVQGLLVNLSGFLAAFEMDSDGYVLDCTPAAARALGYNRSDVIGKSLIKHVDDDSSIDALDTLSDLLFIEEEDLEEAWEELEHNKIVRINMQRQTKRVIQTTWDAVRLDKDKDVAIVIMHKERLTNKIRRKVEEQVEMDQEEVALIPMTHDKNKAEDHKEEVELSAVERAKKHTEPVKYHFAVMQPEGNINKTCTNDDFRKYLASVWQEQRPWELHRLNVYMRAKVQQFFKRMSQDKETLDFASWETWWNKSENRTGWDGGAIMEHIDPPGKMDPYDYDRKKL